MPPSVVVTTGAVLSAPSCNVLVRLRICCACCAASCSASAGANEGSVGGVDCVGLPPTIDGNVGELGGGVTGSEGGVGPVGVEGGVGPVGMVGPPIMIPKFAPTKSPAVLLAPVLVTTPEAIEFVIVPVLTPTKPPTVLLAPVLVTAPAAVEFVMVPALSPTNPP